MAWSAWTRLAPAAPEFALDLTLTSGQAFSWTFAAGAWAGVLHCGTPVRLRESNSCVEYCVPGGAAAEDAHAALADYFRLQHRTVALYAEWARRDPHFAACARGVAGLRLLRQDPVENLFSFICSSNNNIARITGMVHKLAARFGALAYPGDDEVPPLYAFPTVDALADPAVEPTLRSLGFGYRAKYIMQTAQHVQQQGGRAWLDTLRKVPYDLAKTQLMTCAGVGAKVADCVLLMSLDKLEAIPVDTHVWQIAIRDYGFKSLSKTKTITPANYAAVGLLFQNLFGPLSGWAHSVLFTADLAKNKPVDSAVPIARPMKPSSKKRKPTTREESLLKQAEGDGNDLIRPSADISQENIVPGKRQRRTVAMYM